MNKWVKKSIEIANSEGYLDKLLEVYPANILPRRPLSQTDIAIINNLYKNKKGKELVKFLLNLTKQKHPFPVEHPYASLFRQKSFLIKKNPKTLNLLENIILSMSLDDIIRGCERPIDINRVMGQAFQKWLVKHFSNKGIPFLPSHEFKEAERAFLKAGKDEEIMQYAKENLNTELTRGRDFLYKTKNKFVIGEARFLSTTGGSQKRDLIETVNFIKRSSEKVINVGVLDGIVWFSESYIKILSKLGENQPAFTVLLLEDFLDSIE